MNDISFPDSLHGWAVGDTGRIVRTTDGGTHWTSVTSGTPNNLYAVSFLDAQNGFVAGDLGKLLKTTNGGMTWSASTTSPAVAWQKIHFTSVTNGWLISNQADYVYRTTDGGSTWNAVGPVTSWDTYDHVDFWFAGPTDIWVAGGSTLMHTTDGSFWNDVNTYYFTRMTSVAFPTDNIGYVVKASILVGNRDTSIVYGTTDGGTTWNMLAGFSLSNFSSLVFINGNEGWVAGDSVTSAVLEAGLIWHTTDAGAHWSEEAQFGGGGTYSSIRRLLVLDKVHGWCAGSSYLTTPSRAMVGKYYGIPASVSDPAPTLPKSFALGQNYPNPFNPSTSIGFSLLHSAHVKLTVYDMTGSVVATLVDRTLFPGSYTRSWTPSNLPSGTYYYRLEADGIAESRKMLYLK